MVRKLRGKKDAFSNSLRFLTEISKHVLSLHRQLFMQVIEMSEFQSDGPDHVNLWETLAPYELWQAHNHIKMHIFIVQLLHNSPYATWENYQSVCYFKHSLFINLVAWYNKIWLSAPLHVWSNKAYYPL